MAAILTVKEETICCEGIKREGERERKMKEREKIVTDREDTDGQIEERGEQKKKQK